MFSTMLAKLILLISTSAIIASHLKTTPEELQAYFATIDEAIKLEEHEAQIKIRDTLMPLGVYVNDTDSRVKEELTAAAQPYWDEIANLQEQAEADGQNISACTELGNKELYKLNSTMLSPLEKKIYDHYDTAYSFIISTSQFAYDQVEELVALHVRVNACSNDDCATSLNAEAIEFNKRAVDNIKYAIQNATNCAKVETPTYLDKITLDTDSYVESYAPFLEDVKDCIDNL